MYPFVIKFTILIMGSNYEKGSALPLILLDSIQKKSLIGAFDFVGTWPSERRRRTLAQVVTLIASDESFPAWCGSRRLPEPAARPCGWLRLGRCGASRTLDCRAPPSP